MKKERNCRRIVVEDAQYRRRGRAERREEKIIVIVFTTPKTTKCKPNKICVIIINIQIIL